MFWPLSPCSWAEDGCLISLVHNDSSFYCFFFWRYAYLFDLVSTFFFLSFLFDSQGTEQLTAQLSWSLFILSLFPFIGIICTCVPHKSVFHTLQQSTDLRETRQKSLCSGRLVKTLEAICSHPQMECNLCFPSQLAAIEASFIQLKPKLLKPLSSQLRGQHPSAGKRVWSVVREEQPGHAIPTTHISCSNHGHSCRSSLAESSLLLGHKGTWELMLWSHVVHMALCVSASHSSHPCICALSSSCVLETHWQQHQAGVILLFHCVPIPCWWTLGDPSLGVLSLVPVPGGWPALQPHFSQFISPFPVLSLSPNPLMRGTAPHNHLHQYLIFTILSHCGTHQAVLGFFTCCCFLTYILWNTQSSIQPYSS